MLGFHRLFLMNVDALIVGVGDFVNEFAGFDF